MSRTGGVRAMTPLPEPRTVRGNGVDIAIRDSGGAGPALVLLHGLGGASESWAFQFRALQKRYRVIAWDMPGYGLSQGLARETPSAFDYADALAGALDGLDVDRAHVVGQSVAALIGAAFAGRYPGRTLSYTFCQGLPGLAGLPSAEREQQRRARLDAYLSGGAEAFAEQRGRRMLGPDAPDAVADLVIRVMKLIPPRGYCQAVEMMVRSDIAELAPAVVAPALVIAGSADPVSPPPVGTAARAALPGDVIETIEGAGHYGCVEDPPRFNAALERFFERLPPPRDAT